MDLRRVHLAGRAIFPDRVAAARIPGEVYRGAPSSDKGIATRLMVSELGHHIVTSTDGRDGLFQATGDQFDALIVGHVAGYVLVNDLSERAFQLEHGGQWVKGKSCDTFGPVGPWLLTADEVADPQALSKWLEVNGHRYQHGTSADMVFGVAHLVSYISRYMTLMPGDIISTGTPAGVGLGQKPPVYLRPGDVVELGIDQLGTQRQTAVAA